MRWFWLTGFFTALYWLRTLPVFTRASGGWIWLIMLAVVAAGAGVRRMEARRFDLRWLLMLAPLAVTLWIIPFPYNVPVLLLAVAMLLLATGRFSPNLGWVGMPFGLVAMVLAFQAAVLPFLYVFASRVHEIPPLAPFFYNLARIFDPGVSLSGHRLIIQQVYDVFEFPVRLEALGLFPAVLIGVAGCVFLVAARRSFKVIAGFIGLLVGYSILRYVVLVFLTVKFKTLTVFWQPLPVALSYVPLIVMLTGLAYFNRSSRDVSIRLGWPGYRKILAAAGLVVAGAIGVTGLLAYHDPGVKKQGRLLIDELHSDWEWTTQAYDTQWYGRKSGYNYYCLADYLGYFYHVDVGTDSLLPDLLAQYDIVMLKTPTSPYSQREIDALVEFVRGGGGLWLHGDHTNVFGISTHLNQLARRFGLRFRYDSTYDLQTMALTLFKRPAIFPHPTIAFLPTYLFATSCTIDAPVFSENMILGYGLKAMALDYSKAGFFPQKEDQDYGFGLFVQQGGVKYGKGRVALYTDSTCFSNFFMFIPGKPELALATVEWLNRMNRFAWLNRLLFGLGVVSLVLAGNTIRRWALSQQALLGLCAGFLGLAMAILLYDGHVRRSYALPEPHTHYVHVAFESEHSAFTLPTTGLTRDHEISLHTFFVWTQRLGFFPSFEPTLEDALAKGDLVVIANPGVPFEQDELDAIITYLGMGGRMLVLVDPLNQGAAPRQLLGSLAIRLVDPDDESPEQSTDSEGPPGPEEPPAASDLHADREEHPAASEQPVGPEGPHLDIVTLEGDVIVPAARPTGLFGGTPLLHLSDGRTVLTQTRVGRGRAFVFSDYYLFTESMMGHTGETLDARKRMIAEIEYWMLREILDLSQPEPYWQIRQRGLPGAGETETD